MASFSLASYTHRINKKHSKSFETIDDIGGEDLFKIFSDILKSRSASFQHDADTKKVLRFGELKFKNRIAYGTIETGVYGFTSILRDINHKYKITYERKTTEAEMIPFYFQLCFPKGQDRAIFLFQRFNRFGVRKQFLDSIADSIKAKLPEHTTKLNALYPNEAVNSWLLKGDLKSIRLISEEVPSDIADAYKTKDEARKYTSSEFVIKTRRGGKLAGVAGRFVTV
jgi:hypothetical protein